MNSADADYYSVLGIMPDAEDVVVTAAYRALVQRYHPDKWAGDPSEAHRRMVELNAAYAVLSDPQRRAEYDRSYRERDRSTFEQGATNDDAFQTAIDALKARWEIARGVYPDLEVHRNRLAVVSTSLAFAYMTVLLTDKQFEHRSEIAKRMEQTFLERYFGTSEPIVEFARELILAGQKPAARALNALVDVVGSAGDPAPIIARIEQQFDLRAFWRNQREQAEKLETIVRLKHRVLDSPDFVFARSLASHLGYGVDEVGGGFFQSRKVLVTSPTGGTTEFSNSSIFIEWVKQNLCR